MSYYLSDSSHVLITGATGAGKEFGGKTVTLNWWVNESVKNGWHDLGIVFNPKGHRFINGQKVQSLKGLAESYRAGKRRFNFIPYGDTEAVHSGLMEFVRQVPGSAIVGHDEAHEYADSDMLDWCFRQGGNVADSVKYETGDIRSIAATQHPWDLPEGVANNVPLKVWVGPATDESERYFQTMGISGAYDSIRENTGQYRWSVVDGGKFVETNPPVPSNYA